VRSAGGGDKHAVTAAEARFSSKLSFSFAIPLAGAGVAVTGAGAAAARGVGVDVADCVEARSGVAAVTPFGRGAVAFVVGSTSALRTAREPASDEFVSDAAVLLEFFLFFFPPSPPFSLLIPHPMAVAVAGGSWFRCRQPTRLIAEEKSANCGDRNVGSNESTGHSDFVAVDLYRKLLRHLFPRPLVSRGDG
jgi:hypothetical protein